MKGKIVNVCWMTLFTILLATSMAWAQTPANTILYQGKLTDDSGNPIATATSVIFRIWSAPAGGTNLFETTETVTPDAAGFFTIELGPIGTDVLDGNKKYLGMTVEGEDLSPRQLLTSAPAAHSSFAGPAIAYRAPATHVHYVDTALAVTTADSITVTAPGPGYIHVQASMTAIISHSNTSTDEEFYFQISQTRESIVYGEYGFEWISFDNDWPIDTYYFPLSASKVFPVPAAGEYTFYGNMRMYYGENVNDGVYNLSFTAVYYPQACGAVSEFSKKRSMNGDTEAASVLILQEKAFGQ